MLVYEKKEKIYTVFQEKSIHNATRYLDSPEMKALVDAGRKKMDYVILDTPPMSVSSDAELMLKMADNAVLIARQDWTDIRAVNDASDTIRQAGVDFTGFLLNAFLKEHPWTSLREHSYYGYGRNLDSGEGVRMAEQDRYGRNSQNLSRKIEEDDVIDLGALFWNVIQGLLKFWWLILLLAAVGAGTFYLKATSLFYTPMYQSLRHLYGADRRHDRYREQYLQLLL